MAKTITIAPVTRLEGHAKVVIELNDEGNVAEARMQTVELRGFEKFCIGRPVEEMPRIVTSICGVCPWSHHLASAKANDAVFGVTPPPTGIMLRDLCNSVAYTEEHILHFYLTQIIRSGTSLGSPRPILNSEPEWSAAAIWEPRCSIS